MFHNKFVCKPIRCVCASAEITLLIGKAEESQEAIPITSIRDRIKQVMAAEHVDEKAALKKVAKERGLSKSEAYRQMQRT